MSRNLISFELFFDFLGSVLTKIIINVYYYFINVFHDNTHIFMEGAHQFLFIDPMIISNIHFSLYYSQSYKPTQHKIPFHKIFIFTIS